MDIDMPEPIPTAEMQDDREKREDPGRIPPPDRFGAESPESIAESFEQDTRKQLNLLRERTFTPELRTLVDRVRENEPRDREDPLDEARIDSLSEEELELELYRLYYRARSLRENGKINIAFNPFEINRESADLSIQYSLASFITERMRLLSFSPFALLSYNISLKAYAPTVHTLDAHSIENVMIGLRDALFREIAASPEGLIITDERIHCEPFLAKLFTHRTGEAPRPVYFIMLSRITAGATKELLIEGSEGVIPFLPSSILMVELNEKAAGMDPSSITEAIRRKLALPFFILNDFQSLVFSAKSYDDLEYVYNVLDYLFTVFLLHGDRTGIILRSVSKENANLPFLIKYIISKLSNTLFSDSAIVHIIKDKLIILTRNDLVGPVRDIISEYNRLSSDQFALVEFQSNDFEDSVEIIQKYILNN